MPNLKMLTGLSGPEYTLSPGDEREFGEAEASRLIRAGFAEATDGFVPIDDKAEADAEQADAEAAAAQAEADEKVKADADAAAAAAAPKAPAVKKVPAAKKAKG